MATNPDQVQVVHHHVTGVTEVIPAVSADITNTSQTYQEVHLSGGQSDLQVVQLENGDVAQGKIYQVVAVTEQASQHSHQEGTSQHHVPTSTCSLEQLQDVTHCHNSVTALLESTASSVVVQQVQESTPHKELPPGCPAWAARLKDVEAIGDSYRGFVESEVELDLLLTYHKQQTGTFWGTRQSPSQNKPSKRLMWKSQYVPYDGIPFLNAGSRAIVMECQYGPRRKGSINKKSAEAKAFKATCPARIYIKKVRKFPELAVDTSPTVDRRALRLQQDRAFAILREKGDDIQGVERFYVQLPATKAHEYHDDPPHHMYLGVNVPLTSQPSPDISARIHPRVADKIRRLVAEGIQNEYQVRKILRMFVERDLFHGETVPERHNLAYFPTIHDIQNHIYKAIKDIDTGELQVISTPVTVTEGLPTTEEQATADAANQLQQQLWQAPTCSTSEEPQAQTVTVTLTQNPGEDSGAVISLIETTLSDGTTQVSSTLSPKTAHLLSQLNPKLFENAQVARDKNDVPDTVQIQIHQIQEDEAMDTNKIVTTTALPPSDPAGVPMMAVAMAPQSGLSQVEQVLLQTQPQEGVVEHHGDTGEIIMPTEH